MGKFISIRNLVSIMETDNKIEHPLDLTGDELEFLILVTLIELESLNIKNLIKLLNSSKATIYRKINGSNGDKGLVERGLVEIDPINTAMKSGKYYKVTEKARKALKNEPDPDNPEIEKIKDRIKKNPQLIIERYSAGMRSLNMFHRNLINIFRETALGNLNHYGKELGEGNFLTSLMNLELKTKADKKEVMQILMEFHKKLMKYTNKDSKLTENSYPFYISLFPLSRKHVSEFLEDGEKTHK